MIWVFRLAFGAIGLIAVTQILAFGSSILFRSEHPPGAAVQRGYRGTGLVHVYNPRTLEDVVDANQVPESVPYAGDEGAKAGIVYKNVKVLGDVSAGEFTRLMVNMTTWVAPDTGCAACHDVADFAADTLYTKVVARRMLEMVRHINTNWTEHVAQTGVTCYTCHRGKLVPDKIWFNDPGPQQAAGWSQIPAGQNHPTAVAGGAALPLDPFTTFLSGSNEIRVQSTTALRDGNLRSIKQAEWTYSLMMHMSQALGVNCDYCHNSRAFRDWAQSPPQRLTAWHGIRMARDLNNNHLDPLKDILPAGRLGAALGDAPKLNCATCHNGTYKPLLGASMAQGFPELIGPPAQGVAAR